MSKILNRTRVLFRLVHWNDLQRSSDQMDPVCFNFFNSWNIFQFLFRIVKKINEFIFSTGKSNFMDAISFVMGEKTNCLRVKRLSELIHGAAIGRPVSNRCFVTAKFELPDGTKIDFQRSVIGSSADYKINGKVNNLLILFSLFFVIPH